MKDFFLLAEALAAAFPKWQMYYDPVMVTQPEGGAKATGLRVTAQRPLDNRKFSTSRTIPRTVEDNFVPQVFIGTLVAVFRLELDQLNKQIEAETELAKVADKYCMCPESCPIHNP